jgi:hypothetical protein
MEISLIVRGIHLGTSFPVEFSAQAGISCLSPDFAARGSPGSRYERLEIILNVFMGGNYARNRAFRDAV